MNAIVLLFKKNFGEGTLDDVLIRGPAKKNPVARQIRSFQLFFLVSPPPIFREITTPRRAVVTLDLFFWQQPQVFFLVWFLRISDQTNPAPPPFAFGLGSHSLPLTPSLFICKRRFALTTHLSLSSPQHP